MFPFFALSYLWLEGQEHTDWSKVSMVGDVSLAGDDGDALKSGEGDCQGDAHVGSHPEEALRSGERRHIDRLLAVAQVPGC